MLIVTDDDVSFGDCVMEVSMDAKDLVMNVKFEKCEVYVGRRYGGWMGSKWGNPFSTNSGDARTKVVMDYAVYLRSQPDLMQSLDELKGKTLGCWCAPKLCHAHVLSHVANADNRAEALDAVIQSLADKMGVKAPIKIPMSEWPDGGD